LVSLVIRADDLPLFTEAASLAQQGLVTGASARNWMSYDEAIVLPPGFPDWRRQLLTDPQTSGGLLIACSPESARDMLQGIVDAGYRAACCMGHGEAGAPIIRVEA